MSLQLLVHLALRTITLSVLYTSLLQNGLWKLVVPLVCVAAFGSYIVVTRQIPEDLKKRYHRILLLLSIAAYTLLAHLLCSAFTASGATLTLYGFTAPPRCVFFSILAGLLVVLWLEERFLIDLGTLREARP